MTIGITGPELKVPGRSAVVGFIIAAIVVGICLILLGRASDILVVHPNNGGPIFEQSIRTMSTQKKVHKAPLKTYWTVPSTSVPNVSSEWSNSKLAKSHRARGAVSAPKKSSGKLTDMKTAVSDFVQTERLAQQMDEHGLDAIVARARINFTYLSGLVYPGTLARHLDLADSPRGVYLVWPRSGEPRTVVNAIAEGLARRDSFIEHFDVYEGYSEPPVERIAKVITGMGLAESKIGFETNFISAADWEILRSRLPRMRFSDSVHLMDMVRAVKTPAELGRFKRGADLLDEAYLTHFPAVRPSMRERDLHAVLVAHCLAGGSEFTHGILNSQHNTVPYAGESDFPFASGDAIRTDYVAYVQGYPGHQSRCAVLGTPSAGQRCQYALIRDIYRAANGQLIPGRTAGEVYQFVVERFAAAGMAYKSMLAGHSVGAWWHQQEPVISRDNPRRLEEGMVIAMEPHVDHWHIQDMFVIRADGPELISDKFPTETIFACG